MKKTITFLQWKPKRDELTDNFVCHVKFSVIDSDLIGTAREVVSIHTITITITDILLSRWGIPGGLDFGITDEMVKVILQVLEDHLTQQIKKTLLPRGELEPLVLSTENSPESCPYNLNNILYPSKMLFEVETEDQNQQKLPTNQININGNVSGSTLIIGNDNVIRTQPENVTGSLEIVDIAFQDDHRIVLDIKLRNTGSQIAFIKTVIITVNNTWRLSPVYNTGALIMPSANYDIELPIQEIIPYSVESSISQAISPNDVDRFTLVLMSPPHYVILAQLSLIYDSDNKRLSSDNLIFAKSGSSCSYPMMSTEKLSQMDEKFANLKKNTREAKKWFELREIVLHNNSVREQIKTVEGIKNKIIHYLEVFESDPPNHS